MVNRKFRNGEILTAVDAIVFIPYEEVSPVPCNAVAVHSADRFQEPDNFGEKEVTSQWDIRINKGFGPVRGNEPCRPAPIYCSQVLKSDVEHIYGSAGHDLFPFCYYSPCALILIRGFTKSITSITMPS